MIKTESINSLIDELTAAMPIESLESLESLLFRFDRISDMIDELPESLFSLFAARREQLANTLTTHPDYPNGAYLADDSL